MNEQHKELNALADEFGVSPGAMAGLIKAAANGKNEQKAPASRFAGLRRCFNERVAWLLVLPVCGVLWSMFAHADPSDPVVLQIPYEGTIAKDADTFWSSEEPVNFEFRFFSEAAGGVEAWSFETESMVTGGRFSVLIGSEKDPIPPELLRLPFLYFEIALNGAALTGRQRLVPPAYASTTGLADHSVTAEHGVPPGTIVAFGGDLTRVPSGWLPCDGQFVEISEYPDLFAAIGHHWGPAPLLPTDNADTSHLDPDALTVLEGEAALLIREHEGEFMLPDLRGRFMRGIDYTVNADDPTVDPDLGRRTDHLGIPVGGRVGSYQGDEFRSHDHSFRRRASGKGWFGKGSRKSTKDITSTTAYTGGSETRPVNAAVSYIIKY